MRKRREGSDTVRIRSAFVAGVAALWLGLGVPVAQAALLPPNFFDSLPDAPGDLAAVEADELFLDARSGAIVASGHVGVRYAGYAATADRMTFNQHTRDLELVGHVAMLDPNGVEYTADSVKVTGGFKTAIIRALVMVTPDGAMVRAESIEKISRQKTVLDAASYAPCGTCVDEKGRRIGWRVRADKITQHTDVGYVDLEDTVLEVLGVPIAWLPWLRLPDPTDDRLSALRAPKLSYNKATGVLLTVPYYQALNRDMGIVFLPTLVSRQGLMVGAEFIHKVGDIGRYSVSGYGIYQLDPGAFSPGYGDTDWRGALQTSGRFTPSAEWTLGWSYSAFSDPAFLDDYDIETGDYVINQAYAKYLTAQSYAEARVQEFKLIGEISAAEQDAQGALLPSARFDHLEELGTAGDVRIAGTFTGVTRAADATDANGVPYVFGYEEHKTHGTLEAMWSRQTIVGGLAVTPYAGMRLDAASYDGASALDPVATTLFAATPFAAVDLRYPFIGIGTDTTHLVEPVVQLVYRGSDVTETGITNDDAQSYVFDDTNLFSFNKFSGTDRQQTGLFANVGGHYLMSFADGSYLDVVAGQSFHLAGPNAFDTADAANAGAGAGLGGTASHFVAGVRGAVGAQIGFGAKVQIDPDSLMVTRAAADTTLAFERWALGLDYGYIAADAARGTTLDRQGIGGSISVPLADYWSGTVSTGWDLTAGQWDEHGIGLVYDDGYVEAGAEISSDGPQLFDPNSLAFELKLKLKGPDGQEF